MCVDKAKDKTSKICAEADFGQTSIDLTCASGQLHKLELVSLSDMQEGTCDAKKIPSTLSKTREKCNFSSNKVVHKNFKSECDNKDTCSLTLPTSEWPEEC